MRAKKSQQILAELEAEPDGLLARDVGIWTLEKLATLLLYFEAFSRACQKAERAGGAYYVDGMAGPGLCAVRDAVTPPYYVWGSPLLAMRTKPLLRRGIFLELNKRAIDALIARCSAFEERTDIYRGDVNSDLVPILREELPPRAPAFCLLDPEGLELHWRTVRGLANLPNRRLKPELLILFPLDMGIVRLLPVAKEIGDDAIHRIDLLFGNRSWWDIYQDRLSESITPSAAKQMYLELYTNQIRALGYRVLSKHIVAPKAPGLA